VATKRSTKDKKIYGLKMIKQAMARMFIREIRKVLMAGTLPGMISTVKNDGL
jgi:hypothetical protein